MMNRRRMPSGLLGLMLAFLGVAQAQAPRPRPAKKAPPASLAVPFQPGEKLSYRIQWGPAEAASAELSVLPHHQMQGFAAWHFHAKASTIKTARFLYALDDQFASFTEPYGLASLQYEMTIREPNKRQDRVIRMNREGAPPPEEGPAVRVPSGTCDPLGLVYALRAWDWSRKKDAVFPLYDGNKLYEVQARQILDRGSVTVPHGAYAASRVELRVFERKKELTNVRLWIWLGADAQRTPVLIEAEMPFGKLRVELADTQPK